MTLQNGNTKNLTVRSSAITASKTPSTGSSVEAVAHGLRLSAGLKQVDLTEVVVEYWGKALAGYEPRMIDAAFEKYWLTGKFFPVPAQIIELIREQIVAEAPGPGERLKQQLEIS
jgi:hypothetical protein